MKAESEPVQAEGYYEITVPTIVSLRDTGDKLEANIDVDAKLHNRKWLQINVTSNNNFSLVGQQAQEKIPYTLSGTEFVLNPQYPLDNDDAEYRQTITASTDGKPAYADQYKDTINFEITSLYDTRTIVLDCNGGNVDGQSEVIYTIRDGSSYGKLPVPQKVNADFLGWKDESNNTIYSGSTVMPTTEKLTAAWMQQRTISVVGYLNNNALSYTVGVATFDAYINGAKQTNDSDGIYLVMHEGDTFLINDIKIKEGYLFSEMRNQFSYFDYHFDENGGLQSISGTLTNNMPIHQQIGINFAADTQINRLLAKTGATDLTIDSKIPTEVENIGNITIFDSDTSAYVSGDTLHLYNPNGGKVIAPVNASNLFSGCSAINMDLRGLDTSEVTNMTNMFRPCPSMKTINVEGWNVSKVTTMAHIFADCTNLKTCDLSSWNTENLIDMSEFFWSCHSLSSANVTNLDVSKVTDFCRTFGDCYALSDVDVSKWDTHSATSMFAMFWYCAAIKKLDLSNFNTSKVTTMSWMLGAMNSLQELKGLENFDTSNVTRMDEMFANYPLVTINLSSFNTSKLVSADNMFAGAKITELDLSNFDLSHLYRTNEMFKNCINLKKIYVSESMPTGTTSSQNMFLGCTSLVGGAGTVYDPTFFDATAARIDGGPNAPGYFTDIADKPTSSILEQVAQPIEIPKVEEQLEENNTQNLSPVPEETPAIMPQENVEESVQENMEETTK